MDEDHSTNLQCVCHDSSVYETDVRPFQDATWFKFLSSIGVWKNLIGTRSDIANSFIEEYGGFKDVPMPPNAGYHKKCYKYFTDTTKQARGLTAKRKHEGAATASAHASTSADQSSASATHEDADETPAKAKRLLRSSTGFRASFERPHVLSPVCVICRSNKWLHKGPSKSRVLEHLTQCELISGGQLTLAAEKRKDEALLTLIKDQDCVAIEVKYHPSCYRQYTRFLSKPEPSAKSYALYVKTYPHFAKQIIEGRLIKNKEILRLSKLKQLFVKAASDVEKIDASGYKVWNLKKRLKHDYPQLCFLKPTRQYESEFVYADTISAEDLVLDIKHSDSDTIDTNTTPGSDNGRSAEMEPTPVIESTVRERFNTAIHIKQLIDDIHQTSLPWPPKASDLSIDKAQSLVPPELFNLLAWIVGSSSDPEDKGYIKVSHELKRRLLTIAQDIIYLASKGRKRMPKHISLGMAIRHLSGSAQIIGLLNGYGYTTSHTSVLEHDTALAMQEINQDRGSLPSSLQKGVYTTLVWDNSDFGEDTLSGKGTTHNTNGIAIQHCPTTVSTTTITTDTPSIPKTKQRSLPSPEKDLIPFSGQRRAAPASLADVSLDLAEADGFLLTNKKKELAFSITKVPKERLLPSWTGFNQLLATDIPPKATIAYLPIINGSPTEFNTVNTLLHRSIDLADALDLPSVVVVVDQAIYAKAQIIRWQTPNFMNRIVIRLGAFHTVMTALACIGQRFGDAGLKDILIEAETVASGSINGVISGHHYNRSVRANKLLSEALERLRWKSFLESLPCNKALEFKTLMSDLHFAFPHEDFNDLTQSNRFEEAQAAYEEYIKDRCKANATFAFWSSYLQMVQDVLLFIRASREGNWNGHLASVRRLLPWIFAYDRSNYARYLPVYWLEMCNLPITHPFIYEELQAGNFAVQRNDSYGFARVPCDMTIEQTANRDSKTRGGMRGFTISKGAVNRWIQAHHERGTITRQCEEMAGKGEQSSTRADLTNSRMQKDRETVDTIIETISCMVNPFDLEPEAEEKELIHITSGVIATPDVTDDLLKAYETGDNAMRKFTETRLLKNEVGLHDTLPKLKLKTFGSMGRKKLSKEKGKVVTMKSSRELMSRLVIVGKKRDIDLHEILSHCLDRLPTSIAKLEDEGLVKTAKAKLLHYLESSPDVSPIVETPKAAVWIVDGMALLQSLSSKNMPSTMGGLASNILNQLVFMALRNQTRVVHFVTDTYPAVSVKNVERQRRSASGSQRIKISRGDQPVPKQWKKFLSESFNKQQLVDFLFEQWKTAKADKYKGVTIYITHNDMCHKLEVKDGKVCAKLETELCSTQEEADTRIYLHANYISKYMSGRDIVITSPDTDVLVIGVAVAEQLAHAGSSLYFLTGRENHERTLHVEKICQHFGTNFTKSLIGLHCFTGCDSVSSFYSKGKTKTANLLQKHPEFLPGFQALGTSHTIEDSTVTILEDFVCKLYGQASCSNVNTARYLLFSTSARDEYSLPPNHDALYKHIQRANYQAAIFKQCMVQNPIIPSPVGNGWKMVDGDLVIDWMDMEPAERSVLELTVCACKKSRCKINAADNQCCSSFGLLCTDLCTCKKCENAEQDLTDEDDYITFEESDDDGSDEIEDFYGEEIF